MTQRTVLGLWLVYGICFGSVLTSFPTPHGAEPLRLRTAHAQGTSSQAGEASQEEVNRLRQEVETVQAALTQSRQEVQQATIAAAEARQRLQSAEVALTQRQTAFQEEHKARTALEAEAARLKQTLDGAQQALEAARQEGRDVQQQLTTVQQQLAQTAAGATATQTRLQDAEALLHKERMVLAEVQKVHAAQREDLGQLQQVVEKEQRAHATTRQDVTSAQQALEAALARERAAAAEVQHTQATHKAEATRLQQALQSEQQAHTATRQTLTTAQAALSAVEQQRQATEQQQAQGTARRQALVEQMRALLAGDIQRQMVTVSQGPDHVRLQVASDALFLSGKAVLRDEAQTFLDKLAALLQDRADHPVRIEGHTDNVPIHETNRKQWPTNWELSTARAAAVARAFMSKGLAAERVVIGGYGASRPIAANETRAGQMSNRRLDVIVRVPAGS